MPMRTVDISPQNSVSIYIYIDGQSGESEKITVLHSCTVYCMCIAEVMCECTVA